MNDLFNLPKQKLGTRAGAFAVGNLSNEDSVWHETAEEIGEKLGQGKVNAERLRVVYEGMSEVLNEKEIYTLKLRYQHGFTYWRIAEMMDQYPSTVMRRCKKAIVKLRRHIIDEAKQENTNV